MAKYREKLRVVDGTRWLKNGDHPKDNCHPISPTNPALSEGKVVRYYRTPEFDGQDRCCHCGDIMHNHGWIDTCDDGRIVCPGDWIITGTDGKFYPCKPDVFAIIYELKEDNEVKLGKGKGGRRVGGETATMSFPCPKCGRYGMEWDARAKIFYCYYRNCNHFIRIKGQKGEPSSAVILEAIEKEMD